MGGHGLEEVCRKSVGILVDCKQLNVSSREVNVIFDRINKNMISKMREVISYSLQHGKTTPGGYCVCWGAPFNRGAHRPSCLEKYDQDDGV